MPTTPQRPDSPQRSPSPNRSSRLVLTRRGRLARTIIVGLLALLVLALVVTLGVRALASHAGAGANAASDAGGADGSGASATATPAPTAEVTAADQTMRHSGTQGDGTWNVAEAGPVPEAGVATVHTYALRTENGTGIDANEAAGIVNDILTDPRGWQPIANVVLQRVADPAQAEFTISVGSPPTVDSMCAPASTNGTWSCRRGHDVVLNSDRWLYMTPTYTDLDAYRAYMVNHEVGHFLGHNHETCGGPGKKAPVMLQQSMDLGGCTANAWPAEDGQPADAAG